ncbi:MAG: DUF87 domain-containing protein [Bacilli bacterium]|nr:DUF87 domain-containing protein [Bacilli bacterium]
MEQVNEYSTRKIKRALGVTMILFTILVILSPSCAFWGLGWLTIFLGGIVAFYGFGILVIFFGILLATKGDFHKPTFGARFFLGAMIFLLGLGILWSQAYYAFGQGETTIDNFITLMNDYAASTNGYLTIMLFSSYGTGGGIISTSIAYGMSLASPALTYFISILLIVGGIVLSALPQWKKLFSFLNKKNQMNKAERDAKKATKEAEESIQRINEEQSKAEEQARNDNLALPYGNTPQQSDDSMMMLTYDEVEEKPLEQPQETLHRSQSPETIVGVPLPDEMLSTNLSNESSRRSNGGLREVEFEDFDFVATPQNQSGLITETSKPQPTPVSPTPSYYEAPGQEPVKEEPVPESINIYPEPQYEEQVEPAPSCQEEEVYEEPSPSYIQEEEKIIIPANTSRNGGIDSFLDDTPSMPRVVDEPKVSKPSYIPEPEPEIEEEPPVPERDPNDQPPAKERGPYVLPPITMLNSKDNYADTIKEMSTLCDNLRLKIDDAMAEFRIGAHVEDYTIGPSVTRFEIAFDSGVSTAVIESRFNDIRRVIGGQTARFVRIIPHTIYSGIEIVNERKATVTLKKMLDFMPLQTEKDHFLVPFGLDIPGNPVYADIRKFPHMLVAGTTGSGKSVFVNGIILSLIMRNRPEDVKMVMVDPKSVEFSFYQTIPHLLCPVITDMKEARKALDKLVEEMDRRYKVFAKYRVNNIGLFNEKIAPRENLEKMPYIFLFIDEFAELVAVARDVEVPVQRIGQKARAAGIHMVIATQRPEVKVVSGTIKANLPCHVALKLKSFQDSRTIIDKGGAEALAGNGDMLVDCDQISSGGELLRVQGCYMTDDEMNAICDYVSNQQPQSFDERFMNLAEDDDSSSSDFEDDGPSRAELKAAEGEEKYRMIRDAVFGREYISKSRIQATYEVGFPRAGKIMDRLIKEGIVAPEPDTPSSAKGNRVLIHSMEEFIAYQKSKGINGDGN